jgi:hypothetical protein
LKPDNNKHIFQKPPKGILGVKLGLYPQLLFSKKKSKKKNKNKKKKQSFQTHPCFSFTFSILF